METYSYVNIFATKGLEYLLLGFFLLMFVLLLKYLTPPDSKESRRTATDRDSRAAGSTRPVAASDK